MTESESLVVADVLDRQAARYGDRIFAVFHSGEEWSYKDIASGAWRVANGLIALGVQPGDRVACWMPSGPESLLSWFGTSAAGGVWAPVNPAYRGSILEHVLNLIKARVLVTTSDLLDRLASLALPWLEVVIVVDDDVAASRESVGAVRTIEWNDLMVQDSVRPVLVEIRRDCDDQIILFTSGTTGLSKAVRCSSVHHHWAQMALLTPEITADDRYYECLPMFHLAGTGTVYGMLARGGSIAVTSGFKTDTFWSEARQLGVTAAMIITSMSNVLMGQPPSSQDRKHPLRLVLMSPLMIEYKAFAERFGVKIFTTYGMSELPVPLRSDFNPQDHRSCGRPWSDEWELRVVDEADEEVPVGSIGELIARHKRPWVLNSGYFGMPEATLEAWRNGWFHTGDLFRLDAEGNFYFLDRQKDVIRRRGENISSFEVEREVLTHPAVSECAAYAVSDGLKEDEVMIAVVGVDGCELEPANLLSYLETRLPRFMLPRYVATVAALPKSSSMKVQKAELKAQGVTSTTWDRRTVVAG